MHTTKEDALEEEYLDLLERLKREASETQVRLSKAQASHAKAQDMVRDKKAEIKRKDEIISKNLEEIQLLRSLLLTNTGTMIGDGVTANNGIGRKRMEETIEE